MPYLFVGAGQAGSAIVDDVFGHRRMSTLAAPLAINSTVRDLQNLSNVEPEQWYGVAANHGLVEGTVPAFEEHVTGGFGRNPVRADEVMRENYGELVGVLDRRFGGPDTDVPFAFVFLGLGGGTGCGIAPYIADAVKELTDGVAQVIAVGVLPNTMGPIAEQGEGEETISASRQAWNTVYGLDRLEEAVDGIILVDNQRLAYEDAAEGRFSEYNEYVASAVVDLVSGPVLERIDPGEYEEVDPPTVDLQDVVTSLSFDVRGTDSRPGYAALGRSVTMTRSLSGYLLPFVGREEVDSAALPRIATGKQTVAGVDPADAKKALGLLRAPVEYIAGGKRRIQTSTIRGYLESQCTLGEVNMGVALTERNLASMTALFTYERQDVERIEKIEEHAAEYEAEAEGLA